MNPRLLARFGVRLNRGDGKAIAELLRGQLSDRETRRLAFSVLEKEHFQLTCERDGLTWTVDTGDDVGEAIYVDGSYEGDAVEAVLGWLRDRIKTTVVEVGANVGTVALPLAKAGYRVIAIEPVPTTFAMLSRNVEANGFGRQVRCVNRAISTTSGHVDMWITKGSGLSELAGSREPGFSHNLEQGATLDEMKRRITVESTPLGELLMSEGVKIDDIALVWSDTQGSESYVIATGTELWAAGVPLFVEVDPTLLGPHGGIDAFVEIVEATFAKFLTRDNFIAGSRPQDIQEFRTFTATLTGFSGSDALLIP